MQAVKALPTSIKEKGPLGAKTGSIKKFRLREVRQAEKKDRSSNKKESKHTHIYGVLEPRE
eukprot:282087-Pelagomonas_calceolata.AAC.2